MTEKDKDHDKHEAAKLSEGADKRAADKHPAQFDNPNQNPNHPANKTPARDPKAPGSDHIAGPVYSSENLMTEQEKGGLDPVNPAEHTTGPVETIADQGIGPRTPYPEGNPPPPTETITRSQGIKGAADKPAPDKTVHQEPTR